MISLFEKPAVEILSVLLHSISESLGRGRWLSEGGKEVLWQGLKDLGAGQEGRERLPCVQQNRLLWSSAQECRLGILL